MFTNDFPWYKTMGFKALIIVGLMLSVVGITIVSVLETTGSEMVRKSQNQRVEAQVESVAQSLGQLSKNVSTIALSLGDMLATLNSDQVIEQSLINMFNNRNIKQFVAGGGFWPEPYTYHSNKSKASVFIAKNAQGDFERVEDYNKDTASPYQIEEWYTPTRIFDGTTYWSRAYVDPYTSQSMVTCSASVFKNGKFYGVVTIDIYLYQLQDFLKQSGDKLGGYLLMFDRSGRLMSFPNAVFSDQITSAPLLNFRELAISYPVFSELALVMSKAMHEQYLRRVNNKKIHSIARELVTSSPDIDLNYSLSVADELIPKAAIFKNSERLFIHQIKNDPILREPAMILARRLPETNWILIGALPERFLVEETGELKNDLFFSMVLVAVLLVGMIFTAIHIYVLRPMARVRNALIEQGTSSTFIPIDYKGKDELGMLVREFNQLSTNLVETRERALEAVRAKQLFLANISHEIRTPMNGIIGASSLMQDEPLTSKQAEYLSVISHSSRGLMSLINNILDFSKIESNHLKLEKSVFDLEEIGFYVRDLMLPTILDKQHLMFSFSYSANAPRKFIGDAHRIEQIILNLVSNALKFTESGSVQLSINVNKENENTVGAVIKVKDTGVGIAQDKFDLIFDSFQQADISTTRCFGGSGLGLAITKQLVELMGGNISLTSRLNLGSEFIVCLPLSLHKTNKNDESNEIMPDQIEDFSGMACLLVEDNEVNMMIAEKMLSKLGFCVSKAFNGLEATYRAKDKKFDVIFMDIQMPKIDGLAATSAIRASDNINQNTPIIAMTANVLKEDVWRCLSHGMQGHIGKPIRTKEIRTVLNRVLTKSMMAID